MPLINRLVKGVGSGIGLASEAIAERKQKKQSAGQEAHTTAPSPPQGSSQAYTSEHREQYSHDDDDDSSSSDEADLKNDDADWSLDDAAYELSGPPPYEEVSRNPSISPDDQATLFLGSHPVQTPPTGLRPLPQPVILPQRRPKDKSRGFVRAYAPTLGECAGIDQQTFMAFLDDFDKASKGSPIYNVINLACLGVGLAPLPITFAVTIAVQVASRTAEEVQTRYTRNRYLDKINDSLFKPRGLFCMIMTFKPDRPQESVIGMDINPHDQALAKTLYSTDSEMSRKLKSLRLTSGTTQGEMALPESAPLIYPAIDAAADQAATGAQPPISEHKQNALKSSGAFIASYLDRRAQATYAGSNPNSKLVGPPSEKQFASRYSDPNHPANSGTILGLLTGGKFDPKADRRVRRAGRRARRRGQPALSEEEKHNVKMGQNPRKRKKLLGRVMQKDVLYLAIVNLPSEGEIEEIKQELERMKHP